MEMDKGEIMSAKETCLIIVVQLTIKVIVPTPNLHQNLMVICFKYLLICTGGQKKKISEGLDGYI